MTVEIGADHVYLELGPNDRTTVDDFGAWLQAVTPTRAGLACWTQRGLDFMALTREQARELGLAGWETWPDR